MLWADPLGAIQERVDQGEAHGVRFGPCGGGAGETWSRGGQGRIDLDPALPGGGIEREWPVGSGEAQCGPDRLADVRELVV